MTPSWMVAQLATGMATLSAGSTYLAQPQPLCSDAVRDHPVANSGRSILRVFLRGSYENCSRRFRTQSPRSKAALDMGAKSPNSRIGSRVRRGVFHCGSDQNLSWMKDRPVIQPLTPAPAPSGAPLLLRQDALTGSGGAVLRRAVRPGRVSFRLSQKTRSLLAGHRRLLVARAWCVTLFSRSPNDSQPWPVRLRPDEAGQHSSNDPQPTLDGHFGARNSRTAEPRAAAYRAAGTSARTLCRSQARRRSLLSAGSGRPHLVFTPSSTAFHPRNTDDYNFHIDRPKDDYSRLRWPEHLDSTSFQRRRGFAHSRAIIDCSSRSSPRPMAQDDTRWPSGDAPAVRLVTRCAC